MVTRISFFVTLVLAFCCAPVHAAQPNIIFILADDMGYGDLSCMGAKDIQTPNIDRIATEGVKFTDFYANAPGLNPARHLITGTVCGVRVEKVEEVTMREIRHLDKLIDELARGRAMEKILRRPA